MRGTPRVSEGRGKPSRPSETQGVPRLVTGACHAYKMRIVVHDYAGHPNQVYLSRELARRGHQVLHLYAGSFETPRAARRETARILVVAARGSAALPRDCQLGKEG